MLVDSHCHLDFPDFAAELDAVIGRARAAGIGRLVTISTRVKRHAQVLAIPQEERSFAFLGGGHRIAAGMKLPAPAPVFPRYIEPPGAAAGQAAQ